MQSVLIKKDIILKEKTKVIEPLKLEESSMKYLFQMVDVDKIFKSFDSGDVFNEFYSGALMNYEGDTLSDLARKLTNIVKMRIMTAIALATTQIRLINQDMSIDQQINKLIELKSSENLDIVQKIITDTLEDNFK